MKPFKAPITPASSASAEDLDDSLRGQAAAQAESDRIQSWTQPSFAQGGRHQLQKDPSFAGYKKR